MREIVDEEIAAVLIDLALLSCVISLEKIPR